MVFFYLEPKRLNADSQVLFFIKLLPNVIIAIIIYLSLWHLIKQFMVLHGITSQVCSNFRLFSLD